MHIKKGLIIKSIDNEYVLIDAGIEPPIFNGIIKLNKTGKRIIELLETKDMDIDELYLAINKEYEVDKDTFISSIRPFLDELKIVKLLDE